jgi:hypothetical protein
MKKLILFVCFLTLVSCNRENDITTGENTDNTVSPVDNTGDPNENQANTNPENNDDTVADSSTNPDDEDSSLIDIIIPGAHADEVADTGGCLEGFSKVTGYSNLRHKSADFCIKDTPVSLITPSSTSSTGIACERLDRDCNSLGFELCTKLQAIQASLQGQITLDPSYYYAAWVPIYPEETLECKGLRNGEKLDSSSASSWYGYCCYR